MADCVVMHFLACVTMFLSLKDLPKVGGLAPVHASVICESGVW